MNALPVPETPEGRRKLVEEILWAAQKARSNYHEYVSALDFDRETAESVLQGTQKYLAADEPLNLIEACQRTIAGDREVTAMEVYNILILAHKTVTVLLWFDIQGASLPEPGAVLRAATAA